MDIVKIVAIGITGAFFSLFLKEYKPFLSVTLAVITSCVLLFLILPQIEEITSYAKNIYRAAGGNDVHIDSILKITGIACLAWFGSDICKDAGLSSVSSAIVIAGKSVCLVLCIPIVSQLFEMLVRILP